jgi:hypothetical protein
MSLITVGCLKDGCAANAHRVYVAGVGASGGWVRMEVNGSFIVVFF